MNPTPPSNERNPRDVLSRPAASPDLVLSYGTNEADVVDLFLPKNLPTMTSADVVLVIHGGFWRDSIDRIHTRPMAEALRELGCIVAVPEYRRAHPNNPAWPAAFDDLRLAHGRLLEWLDGLTTRIDRLTVTGHSAGGHLALLLGMEPEYTAVVALAPVADLMAADAENLGDGAASIFMGGTQTEIPEAYAAANPATLLRSSSVASRVTVLHGTEDEIVPLRNARAFAEQVPRATLVELDGADHFALIDPQHSAWAEVADRLTSS